MPWNSNLIDTEILAVHAALLPSGPSGQVLIFGGDEHWGAQAETQPGERYKKTRIFDLDSGALVSGFIASPDSDVFCAGHAFLPDGRLLIGGGTSKWPESDHHDHGLDFLGHRRCWVFNPFEPDDEKKWIEVKRMLPQPGKEAEDEGGGRWYPTLTTLGNGEVIAFFGHVTQEDFRHRNTTPEKYNVSSNNWTLLPQMANPSLLPDWGATDVRFLMYPRTFVLPSGLLFFATPMPTTDNEPSEYFCTFYNPTTGDYVGPNISPAPGWSNYWDMPAVLLPLLPEENYRARIMACGAIENHIIDLEATTPSWFPSASRTGAAAGRQRLHSIAVILPTGEIVHTGGVSAQRPENPVLEPEVYNPGIDWNTGTYSGADSWQSKEAAQLSRNYHSTALLLPDGRVWTAGGNTNAESGDPDGNANADADGVIKKRGIKQIEIYEPDYFSSANKPQITSAPKSISFNQQFQIRCSQAASIQRVAFIRNGSVTHGHDYDQRYVGLSFEHISGDRLLVTAPPSGNVAPPGYYTLWVINDSGIPCEQASFVRMSYQTCEVITDRSTFSTHEVEAMLADESTAVFTDALYVIYDGFIPSELNLLGNVPDVTIAIGGDEGTTLNGISLNFQTTLFEDEDLPPGIPQRITFVYNVVFSNATAFNFPGSSETVRLNFDLEQHSCVGYLNLIKDPNPYMRDSVSDGSGNYNPHWLSTDLRVFQIEEGDTFSGTSISHGASSSSPFTFINELLEDFNTKPENNSHPFRGISTGQQDSKLELARTVNGRRVFNYAIAKVRYRVAAVPPGTDDMRVFFRMFKTAATGLQYNTNSTYRRFGDGPTAIPLLGISGYELSTIPFFAAPRVNTASQSMESQSDPLNIRPFSAGGSEEQTIYFGCWLDINQDTAQFPIAPGENNGPFTNRRTIQELIRGEHQCLVAEIHFLPDPISPGKKPGNSDNLSQRNLAIVSSDNPGSIATHTVQHTFEIKVSKIKNFNNFLLEENIQLDAMVSKKRNRLDELLIRWNNVPRDSVVQLFFSGVDVDDILTLVQTRLGVPVLKKIDSQTLECKVKDVTYIPIPPGSSVDIPALISVQLPDNVVKDQHFHASVHQISGRDNSIIGAFEISMPVSEAPLLLASEVRKLSVMRHIAAAIPATDHWYPVFQRYIGQIADRVDGFGGNSTSVYGNPDGTGEEPKKPTPSLWVCTERWWLSILIAVSVLLAAGLTNMVILGIGLVTTVMLGISLYLNWYRKCLPSYCVRLQTIQLGLLVALGVIALMKLIGVGEQFNPSIWLMVGLGALLIQILIFISQCNPCKD